MKEPGLIKYTNTVEGDRAVTTKEYDTSIVNLFFGLMAVSVFSLASVAIVKIMLTTPPVVIQQQRPTNVGY